MSETEKSGGLKQEFKTASHEATAKQPAKEEIFLTAADKHDADRAALMKTLDAQVLSGKIDKHEMRYQLSRFENDLSGDYRKQNLTFFEDKNNDRSPAGSQKGEPSQAKGQGEGRTLSFFEDKTKDQDQGHKR